MATEKYLMEKYKRFLLNRTTVTPVIVECIENCLTNEEETANQSFHKIMIHNWQDSLSQVFDIVSGYYGTSFIPVNCISQGELTSFYTSSLNLILKLIKFDFIFPFSRNMFNVDVLFNDKTATDFFGRVTTVEDIVSGVVCRRFNENSVLDLSNFCEDPEFVGNKIFFYKLSLLSQFKILMLRMGRDTKKLILRNNSLSQAPVDILNFFIKSDLTAIDLSYNNIPSLQELHRVSSKIEKLWIEGNPLCEELEPIAYVKTVTIKFPRLVELDGMKLNQHGILIPFFRNYLTTNGKNTKMVIERFVSTYFSTFDNKQGCQNNRHIINTCYEPNAKLTITTDFNNAQEKLLHYSMFNGNLLNPERRKQGVNKHRILNSVKQIMYMYGRWPKTAHDLSTLTIDVLCHNASVLMLTVDGIFKELVSPGHPIENVFQFRRTFLFNIHKEDEVSVYKIQHEMINLRFATAEQIRYSFQKPIVDTDPMTPIDPTSEEKEALFKVFQHLTQLKKSEAESRLQHNSWNIYNALKDFTHEFSNNLVTNTNIPADRFLVEDEDFSDSSSLLDEID